MDIHKFGDKVAKAVKEKTKSSYTIQFCSRGRARYFLDILKPKNRYQTQQADGPLRPFFHESLEGGRNEENIQHIPGRDWLNDCFKIPGERDIPLDSFAHVKDRIAFALLNPKCQLMEYVPHIRYLDLAIAFYILSGEDEDSYSTRFILDSDLRAWGIGLDIIYGLALVNTPRILPATQATMAEFGHSIGKVQDDRGNSPFCIIGNAYGIYGAAVMLYPDILRQKADQYQNDVLILPMSVKTVMVLPDNTRISYWEWSRLISSISRKVPSDDVLLEHPYLYRKETGELDIVGIREEGKYVWNENI